MPTYSLDLPLGTPAPDFTLPEVVSGRMISLSTFSDAAALLVLFICRHCPYVTHVQDEIVRIGRCYGPRGVGIVAISANDPNQHAEDGPDGLKVLATEL